MKPEHKKLFDKLTDDVVIIGVGNDYEYFDCSVTNERANWMIDRIKQRLLEDD